MSSREGNARSIGSAAGAKVNEAPASITPTPAPAGTTCADCQEDPTGQCRPCWRSEIRRRERIVKAIENFADTLERFGRRWPR